jgi:hypothetical protein
MVVLWLILVGVIAFIASLVLTAFSSELQSGDNGQAHALSRSAVGYAGMAELLRQTGRNVRISRTDRPSDQDALIILTPGEMADTAELRKIRFTGPRLIVPAKWATSPHPIRQGWVQDRDVLDDAVALTALKGYGEATELRIKDGAGRQTLLGANGERFALTGPINRFRTLETNDWAPVITDDRGDIVLGRRDDVWVLSDPDLLNTQGIANLESASSGLALLELARSGRPTITFDVTLNGIKSQRNLLQLIFTPPFLGVTLALSLAALLLALQAFGRFGPARQAGRAFALGKQALADNSAALIRMAGREHKMVARYALFVRGEAAKAVGAPQSLDEAGLEALLDRLSAPLGLPPFTELRGAAVAAHDIGSALAAGRRLYSWRLEMTRERR